MSGVHRAFDFSGVTLTIRDLPPPLATGLDGWWAGFEADPSEVPLLDVRVAIGETAVPDGTVTAKRMTSRLGPDEAAFVTDEARIVVRGDGNASAELARSGTATQLFALMNVTLAAMAWRLSRRRAAVVHAAGIVLDGRAFLMIGPEGAGKSTWLELAVSAGAEPLSDDVNLVDASGERCEVLGTPVRTNVYGCVGRGRWPLAAILLPAHGDEAVLERVSGLAARARIAANLPYVAETLAGDGGLSAVIERLVADVPVRRLTFALEPSFVDLLRRF